MKGEEKGNLNCRERKNDLRSFPVTKSRCSNLEKLFDGNGSCYQIKMFQPKTILLLMETQIKIEISSTYCLLSEGRAWDCEEMGNGRSPPDDLVLDS